MNTKGPIYIIFLEDGTHRVLTKMEWIREAKPERERVVLVYNSETSFYGSHWVYSDKGKTNYEDIDKKTKHLVTEAMKTTVLLYGYEP